MCYPDSYEIYFPDYSVKFVTRRQLSTHLFLDGVLLFVAVDIAKRHCKNKGKMCVYLAFMAAWSVLNKLTLSRVCSSMQGATGNINRVGKAEQKSGGISWL